MSETCHEEPWVEYPGEWLDTNDMSDCSGAFDGVVHYDQGKQIQIHRRGRFSDPAVIVCHGLPGDCSKRLPKTQNMQWMGLQLIGYNRPGYRGSSADPGRAVADSGKHVEAVVDALEIEKFAVLGYSVGAAHALAIARYFGAARVTGVAALVGSAPKAFETWSEGMNGDNQRAFESGPEHEQYLQDLYGERRQALLQDPYALIKILENDPVQPLHEIDRRILGEVAMKNIVAETVVAGLSESVEGCVEDALALSRPISDGGWGFDVGDIRVPTRLYSHKHDPYAPPAHYDWMAQQIPGAELVRGRGAHFSSFDDMMRALDWLSQGLVRNDT